MNVKKVVINNEKLLALTLLTLFFLAFIFTQHVQNSYAANPSLISYWPADNNNANDAIGTNHGTLVGDTTFGTGRVGQAFSFDGLGDYVSVPSDSSLDVTNGDFTIDAWIYLTAIDSAGEGMVGKLQSDNSSGWGFSVQGSNYGTPGKINFFANGDWAGQSSDAVSVDAWTHVAITRSGNLLTYYINGSPSGSFTYAGNFDNDLSLLIGDMYPTWAGSVWKFNGLIDETKIYDRALTTQEIADKYNIPVSYWPADGSADDVVGTFNGTMGNGATFAQGRVGQAFSFDGVNDYMNVGDLDLPSTFTISAWIKPDTAGYSMIMGKGNSSENRSYWFYIGNLRALSLLVMNESGQLTNYYSNSVNDEITPVQWNHVAAVYDGSAAAGQKIKLYKNGVIISSRQVMEDAGGTPVNNSSDSIIGGNVWPYAGLIDEPEVFNRALSSSEISEIYQNTPPSVESVTPVDSTKYIPIDSNITTVL